MKVDTLVGGQVVDIVKQLGQYEEYGLQLIFQVPSDVNQSVIETVADSVVRDRDPSI